MPRHTVAIALAAALAACAPQRSGALDPRFETDALNREVAKIAEELRPARLGVGLLDLQTGEVWSFGATPLPLQSVFKAPLGAAVLAEADAGRLSLDEVIEIGDEDLSPQVSAVSTAWPGRRRYTVRELLALAVRDSDNTAADVLMKRIGGPGALTAWLSQKGIKGVRIDRYERELQMEMWGLASFRAAWKDRPPYEAVPVAQRQAALAAYLADPRDTAAVGGLLAFLNQLDAGELISRESRRQLLDLMTATRTGPGRIKAAMPEGATLAHKTGTARPDLGYAPVINDIGIARLPDGRRLAIVILLAGCKGSVPKCEAPLAETARALIDGAGE